MRRLHRLGASVLTGAALITLTTAAPALASATSTHQRPAVTPLRLGTAELQTMRRLYAAYRDLPAGDVARTVSWARAAANRKDAQWAAVSFQPAAGVGQQVGLGFQDGDSYGIFRRAAGGSWKVAGLGGEPVGCATGLPAPIRAQWHLTGCAAPANGPLARPRRSGKIRSGTTAGILAVAEANLGVSDTPSSTNWNRDCNPYAALDAAGTSTKGCGTDPTFGVKDQNQLWCADFAKYVWMTAGVTTDDSTLSAAANSFVVWGAEQGEQPAFDGTPAAGDAIVFYPKNTKVQNLAPAKPSASPAWADHVAIVAGETGGVTELINGDFMTQSNITVEQDETSNLSSYAAGIWGAGEKWVVVAPVLSGSGGGAPPPITSIEGSASGPAIYNGLAGQMQVYSTGASGALQQDSRSVAGSWSGWTGLGGDVTGTPDAVYDYASRNLEVYAHSANGALAEDYWNHSQGWRWVDLGGSVTGAPSAVYDPIRGKLEVYATSSQGTLADIAWRRSPGWSSWASLGGPVSGNPSALYAPNSHAVEVYVTGAGGTVKESYWKRSGGWRSTSLGGAISGSPSATYDRANGYLYVFGRGSSGALQEIHWRPGAGWTHWRNLGGNLAGSPSAAYDPIDGKLEVYAASAGGGMVQTTWRRGDGWSAWVTLDGSAAGSTFAAYDPAGAAMEVYAEGAGHSLQQNSWTASLGWRYQDLGGSLSGL